LQSRGLQLSSAHCCMPTGLRPIMFSYCGVRACSRRAAGIYVASYNSQADLRPRIGQTGPSSIHLRVVLYLQPLWPLVSLLHFAYRLLTSGTIRRGNGLKSELEDLCLADENLKGTTKRDTRLKSRTCLGLCRLSPACSLRTSFFFLLFFFSFFFFLSTTAFYAGICHDSRWPVLAARP